MATREQETNESFELDHAERETKEIRAIGDYLENDLLITQGVIYPLKSESQKTKGLVILYHFNEFKLGFSPAILDDMNLQGVGNGFKVKDRFGARLDTDMTKDGVDKFLTLIGTENTANIIEDLKGIWSRVKNEVNFYYQFFDPRYYSVITAFVIGTYFHDFFSAFPYLWLNGFKKSGKTQLGNLIANLSYCGVASANMSIASLFRMVQLHSPTLFLDEMEQFNKRDEKQDYRSLLNSGYKRMGSDVFRVNQDKSMMLERFKSYCPKVLASINNLDEVLKSRTIPIPCRRNIDPKYNSADREPNAAKFEELRNDLYISRLLNGFKVLKHYQETSSEEFLLNIPPLQPFESFENFESFADESTKTKDTKDMKSAKGKNHILNPFESQIDGRFWDMIKSLLVVSKIYATENDFLEVKTLLLEINKRITVDDESNEEFVMLDLLREIYEKKIEAELLADENGLDVWIELKELTDLFKGKMGWENCSWGRVKNYMIQLGFDKAEDQAKHSRTRRRILRIRFDVLKQKLDSLNYHLEPFTEEKPTQEQQKLMTTESKYELLEKLFQQLEENNKIVFEEEFLQLASQNNITREEAKKQFDNWAFEGIIAKPPTKKGKFSNGFKKV